MRCFMLASLLLVALMGCSSMRTAPEVAVDKQAQWALLPVMNHTETVQAGLRAEAIAENVLRSCGISRLIRYPMPMNKDVLFEPGDDRTVNDYLKWAKEKGAKYAVVGYVDEWRYKVGVDGEPAVGFAFKIIDVNSDAVLWSGSGGKSGWSREAVSAVAQKLIGDLFDSSGVCR
jgi:hypothetical protein